MDEIAGRPYWALHFTAAGALTSPAAQDFVAEIAAQVTAGTLTELFVFSHGWGNSEQGAQDLYQAMFPLVEKAATTLPLGPRGYVGVFWPSLWFPDPPPQSAPAVAAAMAAGRPGAASAALSGAQIAAGMAPSFPAEQQPAIAALGSLIDDGEKGVGVDPDTDQQQRLDAFSAQLTAVLPPPALPPEDAGATAVTSSPKPADAFSALADAMHSPTGTGDAQGLLDRFAKIWAGAKDSLRVASYWEMKSRAGAIGRSGLGPLLVQLHQSAPGLRVHLVGHSFGARLVSFALSGIPSPDASPVCSLSLVQGAFSHYAFTDAGSSPFGQNGALHGVADRVHGPLVATHSSKDWAVGRWYPRASFVARQDTEADDPTPPDVRWGGMGADGYQAVSAAGDTLHDDGTAYTFSPGGFFSLDASAVIADVGQSSFSGAHSDIRHPQVAWLVASAAATSAAAAP